MLKTGIKSAIVKKTYSLQSDFLKRKLVIHVYLPDDMPAGRQLPLLLINDGQNMTDIKMDRILDGLYVKDVIEKMCCVAIEAGIDRKLEFGVAGVPDYLGRGNLAHAYSACMVKELIPFLQTIFNDITFTSKSIAGFSLGALSALDIAWHNKGVFEKVGVFSGSLWWRSLDYNDPAYSDDTHRIMHQQIKKGEYQPGLKFFFQCGAMDEAEDRNNNGIIDSIDDTMDLISELEKKGYKQKEDIEYLELADGKHDMPTWARAMPVFLKWGWGK